MKIVGVSLGIQAGRTADEAATPFVETQKTVRGFRDADAAADSQAHAPVEVEFFSVRVARGRHFAKP